MKRVLLVFGVVIGSLGLYGLADAAQTMIGTTALKTGQSLSVTCSGTKLANTRVSPSSVTDSCSGTLAPTTSPTTTTTSSTTTTTSSTTTTSDPPATTTTTTTDPPKTTGGTCTNPVYSTSEATGTDNTDPNDGYQYWWVDNDAWSGSHGPQTLNVCSNSCWNAVSDQTDNGGQVETYPDTEYDVGGRDNPSTTAQSSGLELDHLHLLRGLPLGRWAGTPRTTCGPTTGPTRR